MNEENKCDECLYEYLSKEEDPCNVCRWKVKDRCLAFYGKLSYFEPKEEKNDDEIDMVNHPQHYQHGIEPIEFIESHNLNFNLGNAVKYIARAPYKGNEIEDLKKAKWYLEREINRHDK